MPNGVVLEIIPGQLVDGVPDKVWLYVAAGLLVLALLAVILIVRARRHKAAPAEPKAGAAFAWDETDTGHASTPQDGLEPRPMDPAFSGPASNGPAAEPIAGQTYNLRCPACQTEFTVNGTKPILTNCPGCGKKGYLR